MGLPNRIIDLDVLANETFYVIFEAFPDETKLTQAETTMLTTPGEVLAALKQCHYPAYVFRMDYDVARKDVSHEFAVKWWNDGTGYEVRSQGANMPEFISAHCTNDELGLVTEDF